VILTILLSNCLGIVEGALCDFVLDLLDLIGKVSNNLYEKFDETLVVMTSLIYRQQPSLFP
jgi:hypothetical protein